MRYLEGIFSTPVSNGQIDTVSYEIAVGLRCSRCYQKFTDAQVEGEGPKHVCQADA